MGYLGTLNKRAEAGGGGLVKFDKLKRLLISGSYLIGTVGSVQIKCAQSVVFGLKIK